MIYGLNFNRTPIPLEALGIFGKHIHVNDPDHNGKHECGSRNRCRKEHGGCRRYYLQGVCNTGVELSSMLIQANNGRRKLHSVMKVGWFGVYTY